MKKLLTLAIAGIAGMASAVTMHWSATLIAFDGTTLKNNDKVTGYLIALDSFADSYTLTESFSASDIGVQVDTKNKTSAVGKLQNYWEIDTTKYDNGSTFAVLLKFDNSGEGGDGKVYYNLSSDLVEMSGMALDPPANANNTQSSFSYSTSSTSGKLTKGGGWTAVPEPSTAMLALAGLALLIRRRKA